MTDARTRLQRAALELFAERGYDRTTATAIAARAGATERTFFRHFPDKREVLFDGEARLAGLLSAAVAATPAGCGPLDTLFGAFRSTVATLEANRAYAAPRHAVIAATPALRERELAKVAALARGMASTLEERGVAPRTAALAAQIGMAAYVDATVAWLDDPSIGLDVRLTQALAEVKALAA